MTAPRVRFFTMSSSAKSTHRCTILLMKRYGCGRTSLPSMILFSFFSFPLFAFDSLRIFFGFCFRFV